MDFVSVLEIEEGAAGDFSRCCDRIGLRSAAGLARWGTLAMRMEDQSKKPWW